jgi:hypothetical protein
MQSAKTAAQSWDGELLGKVFQSCHRLQPFFDSGEIGSVSPMVLGGKVDPPLPFTLGSVGNDNIPSAHKMLISTQYFVGTEPQWIPVCYLLG